MSSFTQVFVKLFSSGAFIKYPCTYIFVVIKLSDSTFWYNHAQNSLRSQKVNMIERVAKNVIFFLGDGMSFATITGEIHTFDKSINYSA